MRHKPIARRHHFVPQSYLARFTDNGTKSGHLYVLDLQADRAYRTSTKNVAVEQDFNRIDSEDYPPDFLEAQFSNVEGVASAAIELVVRSEKFPSDESYSAILSLMALLAIRNPARRASFNAARDHSVRLIAGMLAADKRLFRGHVQKAIAAGADIPSDISFSDFKQFVETGQYCIKFSPQSNLKIELPIWEKIIHVLHERHYSLILAPEEGPYFITCDHPVALGHKSRKRRLIGLGTRQTDLFFPFSPRVGFYGVYEDTLIKEVRAEPKNVAILNSLMFSCALRQVYSAAPDVCVWKEGNVENLRMAV